MNSLRSEIDRAVTAALAEVRGHGENIGQRVATAVEEKFQEVSAAFSTSQARITTTQEIVEKTLAKLDQELKEAIDKLSMVSDGKLDAVATKLVEQETLMNEFKQDAKKNVSVIHGIMSSEVRSMHGEVCNLQSEMKMRMQQAETCIQQNTPVDGARQGPGGARGYQIRVPDPKSWNLTILKNGEFGFLPWRKSFELQVRAIWAGLDVVLEEMREESSPVGRVI